MKSLDNTVITRFVELRAQGRTFTEINADLNVPKLTLIIWSRKYRRRIRYLWGFIAEIDEFNRLGRDETTADPILCSADAVPLDLLDCLVTRTFAVMDAIHATFTGLTSELRYHLPAPSSMLQAPCFPSRTPTTGDKSGQKRTKTDKSGQMPPFRPLTYEQCTAFGISIQTQ